MLLYVWRRTFGVDRRGRINRWVIIKPHNTSLNLIVPASSVQLYSCSFSYFPSIVSTVLTLLSSFQQNCKLIQLYSISVLFLLNLRSSINKPEFDVSRRSKQVVRSLFLQPDYSTSNTSHVQCFTCKLMCCTSLTRWN